MAALTVILKDGKDVSIKSRLLVVVREREGNHPDCAKSQ